MRPHETIEERTVVHRINMITMRGATTHQTSALEAVQRCTRMDTIGSVVPRLLYPAFVACSTKSRGKAWKDLSRMTSLSLASPRIYIAAIARALSTLASTEGYIVCATFLPS